MRVSACPTSTTPRAGASRRHLTWPSPRSMSSAASGSSNRCAATWGPRAQQTNKQTNTQTNRVRHEAGAGAGSAMGQTAAGSSGIHGAIPCPAQNKTRCSRRRVRFGQGCEQACVHPSGATVVATARRRGFSLWAHARRLVAKGSSGAAPGTAMSAAACSKVVGPVGNRRRAVHCAVCALRTDRRCPPGPSEYSYVLVLGDWGRSRRCAGACGRGAAVTGRLSRAAA